MSQTHAIESAVFDFRFATEEFAFAQQRDLDSFTRTRLMAIVKAVFDDSDRDGEIHRIDSLEVDLGTVSGSDYREQLCALLRERLQEALDEQSVLSGAVPDEGERPIDAATVEFEQLQYFLLHGHLPWHAGGVDDDGVERVLTNVLASQGARLAEWLRSSHGRTDVFTRLANQFPEHLLAEVVSALTGTRANELVRAIAEMAAVESGRKSARALWARVIGALSNREQDTQAQPRLIAEAAARQIEQQIAVAEPGDIASDDEPLPASLSAEEAHARSLALIRGYELYQQLMDRLSRALQQLPEETIDELVSSHPLQLVRLFRALQHGAASSADVSAALTDSQYQQLIRGFLALQRAPEVCEPTELYAAIDSYAGQARYRDVYRARLLSMLLADEPIDFEALMAESATRVRFDATDIETGQLETEPRMRDDARTSRSAAAGARRIAALLENETALSGHVEQADVELLERMLKTRPDWLRPLLMQALARATTARHLVDWLSDSALSRALYLLQPAEHHWLQGYADLLCLLIAESTATDIGTRQWQQLKWGIVLELGVRRERVKPSELVQSLLDAATRQFDTGDSVALRASLREALSFETLPIESSARAALAALLAAADGEIAVDLPQQPMSNLHNDGDAVAAGERIYVANAGQVLAAPYLPTLFERLALLDNGQFKTRHDAELAVHLLQYMVDERTAAPEHLLVLNKLLCGLPAGEPIGRDIDISAEHRSLVDGLLDGIIKNWPSIGNTSVAGLREAFLQREGCLELHGDDWHLLVEQRPYDMLLDQLPWSFSTIRHTWMSNSVHVSWR